MTLKSGIISVVGRTNAGKSTLVNRILGEKVSIVSPVAQTTRAVIRGVLTDERGQLVLLDTPGLHKSRSLLTTTMNKRARVASEGTDAILLVVDASVPPQLEDDGWMRRLVKSTVPVVIALNKNDKHDKSAEFKNLWKQIGSTGFPACDETKGSTGFPACDKKGSTGFPACDKNDTGWKACAPIWHSISASSGNGVDALVSTLFSLLPAGEPLFDTETLSDYPRKLAIADIIREHFFLVLDDELPHSIGVLVESIRDEQNRTNIDATILVKRQTHKGIVIGSGGRFIKDAQKTAAKEISSIYGTPATVTLRVKVEPGWDENPFILKQMGFY